MALESRFEPSQFKKLSLLRSSLLKVCKICEGRGYILKEQFDEPCECIIIFKYIKELIVAGIAQKYWTLELEKLQIKKTYIELLQEYIKHLDIAAKKSLGFLFIGANGVGKTASLAELAKAAIVRGYRVQYITAERYLLESAKQVESLDIQKIEACDFLLLDELDKAYIKEGSSYAPKKLEDLIRRSLSNGKSVSIATNMTKEGIVETFGDSFLSMITRYLKVVPFVGEDISTQLQKNWFDELKSDFDYYSPAIVKMAHLRRANYNVDYV
jgi:DNA replication protein DnaC